MHFSTLPCRDLNDIIWLRNALRASLDYWHRLGHQVLVDVIIGSNGIHRKYSFASGYRGIWFVEIEEIAVWDDIFGIGKKNPTGWAEIRGFHREDVFDLITVLIWFQNINLSIMNQEKESTIKYLVLLSTQNTPIYTKRFGITEEDEHIIQLQLVCTLDLVGIHPVKKN